MEQQEFLIGFAQLALVLTGFVAIFVIFLIGGEQKSRVNTHHAASMIIGSLVSVAGALIPIVIYHYGYTDSTLWWWSSLFLLVFGIVNFVIMFLLTTGLTRQELQEAGYIHMLSSYSLGTLAVSLLVYNLAFELSVGNYIFSMVLTFSISVIGFVTFAAQKILHW